MRTIEARTAVLLTSMVMLTLCVLWAAVQS
jgi:hypothetical protein